MGSAELDIHHRQLFVYSNIITYGNASNPEITEMIRDEIETMWNEPTVSLKFDNFWFQVRFKIHAWYNPLIHPFDIYRNLDPKNNYFRLSFHNHISFVDGLNCNSGYLN
jgi:hypothetical protein